MIDGRNPQWNLPKPDDAFWRSHGHKMNQFLAVRQLAVKQTITGHLTSKQSCYPTTKRKAIPVETDRSARHTIQCRFGFATLSLPVATNKSFLLGFCNPGVVYIPQLQPNRGLRRLDMQYYVIRQFALPPTGRKAGCCSFIGAVEAMAWALLPRTH